MRYHGDRWVTVTDVLQLFIYIKVIQLPLVQIDCGSGRALNYCLPTSSTGETLKSIKTAFSQSENGVFHIRKRRFSNHKM